MFSNSVDKLMREWSEEDDGRAGNSRKSSSTVSGVI